MQCRSKQCVAYDFWKKKLKKKKKAIPFTGVFIFFQNIWLGMESFRQKF